MARRLVSMNLVDHPDRAQLRWIVIVQVLMLVLELEVALIEVPSNIAHRHEVTVTPQDYPVLVIRPLTALVVQLIELALLTVDIVADCHRAAEIMVAVKVYPNEMITAVIHLPEDCTVH